MMVKRAVMLLVGHALAVLVGTALMIVVFGIFHSPETAGSPVELAKTLGAGIWLAVALYPLSFVVALPFTIIPAAIFLKLRILSLSPFLVAGAVIPLVVILVARFFATDFPFESELVALIVASIVGGVIGAYVLWLVGVSSIRRQVPASGV